MKVKEFIDLKGWDKETAKNNIKGFYDFDYWWNNKEKMNISIYELFCDKPFCELNKAYNEYYDKSNGLIGSTYDWLSDKPTEEMINRYIYPKWFKEVYDVLNKSFDNDDNGFEELRSIINCEKSYVTIFGFDWTMDDIVHELAKNGYSAEKLGRLISYWEKKRKNIVG